MACTCCSVWPIPPGKTVQPSACAPVSSIEPAGVKWYEKQLCTRSPRRKPAANSGRAKLRVACLERVEMLSHVNSAEKSLWIDREKSVASRPGREASRSEARDSTEEVQRGPSEDTTKQAGRAAAFHRSIKPANVSGGD